MKKLLYAFIFLCSVLQADAQRLRVDSLIGFPYLSGDTLFEGVPVDSITVIITNSDTSTVFNDTLSVLLKVQGSQFTDTILRETPASIPPGTWSISSQPSYLASSSHFDDGDNIVVVWPNARLIPVPVDTLTINVFFASSTSIWEYKGSSPFKIYPNPATDYISIGKPDGIVVKQVRIYDISGKTVYVSSEIEKLIPLYRMKAGLYFMELSGDNCKKRTVAIQVAR